jgi:hypothetical protein
LVVIIRSTALLSSWNEKRGLKAPSRTAATWVGLATPGDAPSNYGNNVAHFDHL